jgi:hypothetical protein
MNQFEESISKGEIKEFILGRSQYFVRDRDWGGHDGTHTYAIILDYLKANGEAGSIFLDNSLVSILKDEFLSSNDLMQVIGILWNYFLYKSEQKLNFNWNVSDNLKSEILAQIKKHQSLKSEILNIQSRLNVMQDKFGFSL